jgi:hypothetical protein
VDENDRVRQLEIAQKRQEERNMIDSIPDNVGVPVTLRSIGTTIWELGKLHTGKGRSLAWSSRGVSNEKSCVICFINSSSSVDIDTLILLAIEQQKRTSAMIMLWEFCRLSKKVKGLSLQYSTTLLSGQELRLLHHGQKPVCIVNPVQRVLVGLW